MATETEQLVVQIEARIDAFEKSFQKASRTANDSWSTIEARGRSASKRITSDVNAATSGLVSNFKGLAGSLAGTLGLSGALGASGFLALAIRINGELSRMGSLAKEANVSTDKIQELKYSANVNGVSDEGFALGMRQSLMLLDEASRQVNDLQRLFNANGKSIRDSNGDLLKFDALLEQAADLISRAPTEQAKARIADMLGLGREWIRALEKGPAEFRKLQEEAHASGIIVDREVIERAKEFDRKWDQSVVRFKAGFTGAFLELSAAFAAWMSEMIDLLPGADMLRRAFRFWGMNLRGMTMPELEAALEDAATNSMGGAAEKIQAEIDRRLGKKPPRVTVKVDVDGPPTVVPKDVQKNPFERAAFEAQKRIASVNAETTAIGLNSEARERAKIVAELEEAAKKANTEAGFQSARVTDAQREKINQLADAMEAAARKNRESQQSWAHFNELLQFSGGIAVDFVDKLGDKTAKLADLASSALNTIKRAALQAALLGQGPLAGIFGTASTVPGGTGGIFGAIGSLFGGARAEGGPVTPGKAFLVGERGPEIILPSAPGTVIPNDRIGGVNNAVATTNVFNVTVNGSAGSPQQNSDLARQMGRQLEALMDQRIARQLRMQCRPGGLLSR
jgi:hypothetical protein